MALNAISGGRDGPCLAFREYIAASTAASKTKRTSGTGLSQVDGVVPAGKTMFKKSRLWRSCMCALAASVGVDGWNSGDSFQEGS